jgi:hypothetical protein
MVELEDGEEEMEGKRSVGLEFFMEEKVNGVVGDASDLGSVEEAVGYDVIGLPGSGAENACEVGSLIAGECGGGVGPGVGDEAATGHASV